MGAYSFMLAGALAVTHDKWAPSPVIFLDLQPVTTSPQILSGSRIPPGAWADTLLRLLLLQGTIVTSAKSLPGTNMALFAFQSWQHSLQQGQAFIDPVSLQTDLRALRVSRSSNIT